jgi:hypothetical protein
VVLIGGAMVTFSNEFLRFHTRDNQ